jgi:hypothetical protein
VPEWESLKREHLKQFAMTARRPKLERQTLVPRINACLAHTDTNSRREFLASAHEIPESMNGLLINLEIDAGLQEEITGILPKLASIDFRGSEFIETCWLDVHFSGDVDFFSCRFRKRAYFEGVFPRRAYFTYAIFDDAVSFKWGALRGRCPVRFGNVLVVRDLWVGLPR